MLPSQRPTQSRQQLHFYLRFSPSSTDSLFPEALASIDSPEEQFMAIRSMSVVSKYQSLLSEPTSESPKRTLQARSNSFNLEQQRLSLSLNYKWSSIFGQSKSMPDIASELLYKKQSLLQQFLDGYNVTLLLKGVEQTGKSQFLFSHCYDDSILRINSLVDVLMRELIYLNGRRKHNDSISEISGDNSQIPPSSKKYMLLLALGEFRYDERSHSEQIADLLATDQDFPRGRSVSSPSKLTNILIQSYDEFNTVLQSALLCSMNFQLRNQGTPEEQLVMLPHQSAHLLIKLQIYNLETNVLSSFHILDTSTEMEERSKNNLLELSKEQMARFFRDFNKHVKANKPPAQFKEQLKTKLGLISFLHHLLMNSAQFSVLMSASPSESQSNDNLAYFRETIQGLVLPLPRRVVSVKKGDLRFIYFSVFHQRNLFSQKLIPLVKTPIKQSRHKSAANSQRKLVELPPIQLNSHRNSSSILEDRHKTLEEYGKLQGYPIRRALMENRSLEALPVAHIDEDEEDQDDEFNIASSKFIEETDEITSLPKLKKIKQTNVSNSSNRVYEQIKKVNQLRQKKEQRFIQAYLQKQPGMRSVSPRSPQPPVQVNQEVRVVKQRNPVDMEGMIREFEEHLQYYQRRIVITQKKLQAFESSSEQEAILKHYKEEIRLLEQNNANLRDEARLVRKQKEQQIVSTEEARERAMPGKGGFPLSQKLVPTLGRNMRVSYKELNMVGVDQELEKLKRMVLKQEMELKKKEEELRKTRDSTRQAVRWKLEAEMLRKQNAELRKKLFG